MAVLGAVLVLVGEAMLVVLAFVLLVASCATAVAVAERYGWARSRAMRRRAKVAMAVGGGRPVVTNV